MQAAEFLRHVGAAPPAQQAQQAQQAPAPAPAPPPPPPAYHAPPGWQHPARAPPPPRARRPLEPPPPGWRPHLAGPDWAPSPPPPGWARAPPPPPLPAQLQAHVDNLAAAQALQARAARAHGDAAAAELLRQGELHCRGEQARGEALQARATCAQEHAHAHAQRARARHEALRREELRRRAGQARREAPPPPPPPPPPPSEPSGLFLPAASGALGGPGLSEADLDAVLAAFAEPRGGAALGRVG